MKGSRDSARSLAVEVVGATGPTTATSIGTHKVLYCVAGSIVFHTEAGDVGLAPGDRMERPTGVTHGASVGPAGVECVEAFRS
ncbi:MAG TPA: hypothetical protein VMU64_06295 [Acidimicrobiales bacterium]|nr:hypothetical protein [Acidimicrobiales bacterium]